LFQWPFWPKSLQPSAIAALTISRAVVDHNHR